MDTSTPFPAPMMYKFVGPLEKDVYTSMVPRLKVLQQMLNKKSAPPLYKNYSPIKFVLERR